MVSNRRILLNETQTVAKMWTKEGDRLYFWGDQRSDEWRRVRTNRVTASVAYDATGKKKSFDDKEEGLTDYAKTVKRLTNLRDQITGVKKVEVNENMQLGIDNEDAIRVAYEELTLNTVQQVAFIIWDKYPKVGVSPDGFVGEDGMIEIKAPREMYKPIVGVLDAISEGRLDPRFHDGRPTWKGRPNHIWYSHYSQMQTQLAVAGRKWCDYVVYALDEQRIYIERIPFNEPYWNWLLSHILYFCDHYLSSEEVYTPVVV